MASINGEERKAFGLHSSREVVQKGQKSEMKKEKNMRKQKRGP
jgi:hypothetical protein